MTSVRQTEPAEEARHLVPDERTGRGAEGEPVRAPGNQVQGGRAAARADGAPEYTAGGAEPPLARMARVRASTSGWVTRSRPPTTCRTGAVSRPARASGEREAYPARLLASGPISLRVVTAH